jgi:predicted enzyme related to lactoylglutathione lyase
VTISAVLPVVPVSDFAAAERWYANFFDRAADRRPMDGLVEWQLGDYAVIQVFHSPDKAGRTVLNFVVDDLDREVADLTSRGITATEPMTVSKGRQRLATISDLDGNQLSLIEDDLTRKLAENID